MTSLVDILRQNQAEITAQSFARFVGSPLRYGLRDPSQYESLVGSIVDAVVLAAFSEFKLGSPDSRELEQVAAFAAAALASEGASAFDVGALIEAVRIAVGQYVQLPGPRAALDDLMRFLLMVTANAITTTKLAATTERVADELTAGTPVVALSPKAIAVFLVGSPDAGTLSSILSRALMRVIASGATKLYIFVDGLSKDGQQAALAASDQLIAAGLPALTYVVWGEGKYATKLFEHWQHAGVRVELISQIHRDKL